MKPSICKPFQMFLAVLCALIYSDISIANNTKAPYIDYNDDIKQCYKKIISLRLNEANEDLAQIKIKHGNNLAVIHLEDYIDFFTIFITEDKTQFTTRQKNKSIRLNQLDENAISSPYYRFIKAEILLHWALARLKFDEKMTAGSEVYEAYKLLEKNKKEYPQFAENLKSLSIIHTLAQSLPGWVRKIIGVKGSIALGTDEIEILSKQALADNNYFFREEVAAIHSYILYYQNNKRSLALSVMEKFKLDHTKNPLIGFLKASIYMRSGMNEKCLVILEECPHGAPYLPFYYLDYMKGKCKLNKLDPDAGIYLHKFLSNFKGQHYIKEAYQRMAWYELVQNNDVKAYKSNIAKCISKGAALLDEDKQSLTEAKLSGIPNEVLLKARLLYDGGYHEDAIKLLQNNGTLAKSNEYSTEYEYRIGRIYQAQGNTAKAKIHLYNSYVKGKNQKTYFACASALQLGIMEEEATTYTKAKKYFNACLELSPEQYASSLHQKAKSGLERLKKKS